MPRKTRCSRRTHSSRQGRSPRAGPRRNGRCRRSCRAGNTGWPLSKAQLGLGIETERAACRTARTASRSPWKRPGGTGTGLPATTGRQPAIGIREPRTVRSPPAARRTEVPVSSSPLAGAGAGVRGFWASATNLFDAASRTATVSWASRLRAAVVDHDHRTHGFRRQVGHGLHANDVGRAGEDQFHGVVNAGNVADFFESKPSGRPFPTASRHAPTRITSSLLCPSP